MTILLIFIYSDYLNLSEAFFESYFLLDEYPDFLKPR